MVFLSKFKAVREISPRRKAMQSHFAFGDISRIYWQNFQLHALQESSGQSKNSIFDKYSIQQHNIHVDGFLLKTNGANVVAALIKMYLCANDSSSIVKCSSPESL